MTPSQSGFTIPWWLIRWAGIGAGACLLGATMILAVMFGWPWLAGILAARETTAPRERVPLKIDVVHRYVLFEDHEHEFVLDGQRARDVVVYAGPLWTWHDVASGGEWRGGVVKEARMVNRGDDAPAAKGASAE